MTKKELERIWLGRKYALSCWMLIGLLAMIWASDTPSVHQYLVAHPWIHGGMGAAYIVSVYVGWKIIIRPPRPTLQP